MINIEIDHNFEQFNEPDWPAFMKQLSLMLQQTLVKNFAAGGRPTKWTPRTTPVGGRLPSYRGTTVSRIRSSSGSDWAKAGIDDARIYDFANEFGAKMSPRVTGQLGKGGRPGSKRFFWAMWRKTGNIMWKYMAFKKEGTRLKITLPKRQAFNIPEEDKKEIFALLQGFAYGTMLPKSQRRTR